MNKPALITAALFGACILLMLVFHFLNWLTKRRLERMTREDPEFFADPGTKGTRVADPPPPYVTDDENFAIENEMRSSIQNTVNH